MNQIRKITLALLVFISSSSVYSGEFEILLGKGDEFFNKRGTIENCLKGIEYYEQACALNPKDISVRIKLARLTYWTSAELGEQILPKSKQIEILNKGIKATEEVLKLEPRNPEAYYWLIWNLGAKTVAEGVFRGGYSLKEAIVGTIFVANGNLNYHYGGIYRYWARVIYTIPGLLGKFFHFSEPDAIWLYQQALKVEPNFFMTRYFLAESYLKMKNNEKALEQLKYLTKTPPEILPEAQIENRFYQDQAKKLLAQLEK